jgi:hypothetical protein
MAPDADTIRRFLRAGLATAIADGLFSSVLSAFFYGSTVARLWQGVASVVLGKEALDGGLFTALVGVGLHVLVAFSWSAVFLFLVLRSARVRAILDSPFGPAKVAAVFGPLVWVVMSGVVIPVFTHRPPSITPRWWIQFFGHAVFVGLPIAFFLRGARPTKPTAGETP